MGLFVGAFGLLQLHAFRMKRSCKLCKPWYLLQLGSTWLNFAGNQLDMMGRQFPAPYSIRVTLMLEYHQWQAACMKWTIQEVPKNVDSNRAFSSAISHQSAPWHSNYLCNFRGCFSQLLHSSCLVWTKSNSFSFRVYDQRHNSKIINHYNVCFMTKTTLL